MQPFTLIERGRQAIERKLKRGQVRISFDIDDTLACQPEHAAAEHSRLPGFVHRWLGEPLRSGTRELIRDLRRQGCSIWNVHPPLVAAVRHSCGRGGQQ